MRYTYKQLVRAIKKATEEGTLNVPIQGYPLIHSVLMEMRDERDEGKVRHWYTLFRELLLHSEVDTNSLDKHRSTLLHVIAREFGHKPDWAKFLTKTCLDRGANANLLDRSGCTALEHALVYYHSERSIVKYLISKTKISDDLKTRCQEYFDSEMNKDVEEINITLVNNLYALRLVKVRREKVDRHNEPSAFTKGVWMRTIANPKVESKILDTREKSKESLNGHRKTSNPNYTPYSPMTLVKSGIPVLPFASFSSDVGVLVDAGNRKIDYWYDGFREELTRDMDFSKEVLSHGPQAEGHEYRNNSAAQIAKHLTELYEKRCSSLTKRKGDEYKLLYNLERQSIFFSWNEGLLRYQRKDITGVLIFDQSADAIKKAMEFKKVMKLASDVPLYFYNSTAGALVSIDWPSPQSKANSSRLHNAHQGHRAGHAGDRSVSSAAGGASKTKLSKP